MDVTVGRTVLYTLNQGDADQIQKTRNERLTAIKAATPVGESPYLFAHTGNQAQAGQVYPAVVVAVWSPTSGCANLQVLLDGSDSYWATSRSDRDRRDPRTVEADPDGAGCWHWPPRA